MKKAGRTARVAIIGIGSPFGDDAAGLEVARRLVREKIPGVEVIAADRPGAGLVELLDGREAVILVDAARSPGGRAGTVHDLELRGFSTGPGPVSSHAFGVAEALALAARLGRLPPHLRLLAIEIGRRGRSTAGFSPAVERAIGKVVARLQGELLSHRRDVQTPSPISWPVTRDHREIPMRTRVDDRRRKHG
jgi:hydrogenase maturation protease